jgi:hypothetical protein
MGDSVGWLIKIIKLLRLVDLGIKGRRSAWRSLFDIY